MKIALLVSIFVLLSANSFAQRPNLDLSKGTIVLPDIILDPPKDLAQDEARYDARAEQSDSQLDDIYSRVEELRGRQAQLKNDIPAIKKDRDWFNKNDKCWNTLGKKEWNCTAPFSGDTEKLKYNYEQARAADAALDAAKAEKKRVEAELAAALKQAKTIEKEREALAKKEQKEIERLRKEQDRIAKYENEERQRAIRTEERDMKRADAASIKEQEAQRTISERQQRQYNRDLTALKSQIKKRDVQSAFTDLKIQEGEIQDAIQMIEEVYDRSLMGIYVQQKIVAVLESDLLCKKVNECQSGKKTQVSQEEILKIFPAAPSLPRGSSSSGSSTR